MDSHGVSKKVIMYYTLPLGGLTEGWDITSPKKKKKIILKNWFLSTN